jgi:hypothetical protein
MVDDPGGTPLSQKITFANASKAITPEGTNVLSTGEAGGTKFLREDGDGTSSWQAIPGGGDALTSNPLSQFASTTSLQLKGVLSDETGSGAAVFADTPTLVTPAIGAATGTSLQLSGLTASEMVITDGTKNLTSAAVATYPSLAELAHVKGVTSAIQTQINAKGTLSNVVEDTTPQLGGDLDLNGNQITSPDGTDLVDIPNGSIDLQTASTSRVDITDLGVRLGGANARVTTILDEDTMATDSATALATQQSIKAYVDASAGGGGNPYGADLVVAASGGDYTTLGQAVAAATAGQVIYVEPGTYTETADRTSAVAVRVIGHGTDSIIDLGAYDITFGAGSIIENIKVTKSNAGYLYTAGADVTFRDIYFNVTTASYSKCIYSEGTHNTVHNCRIDSTTVGILNQIFMTGSYARVDSITCDINTLGSGEALIILFGTSSNYSAVTNCNLDAQQYASTVEGIRLDADNCIAVGNVVKGFYYGIAIKASQCSVTGNYILGEQNGYCIDSQGILNTISGNVLYGASSSKGVGIQSASTKNSVTGNTMRGASSGVGIYVDASNTDISGNNLYSWTTGISFSGSGVKYTNIVGNTITDYTTAINDTATATMAKGNFNASVLLEKDQSWMKNTSGGTLSAGTVVVLKAVAAGDEITTTTTAGDDKVFGVVSESIANNDYGPVQTTGKVTTLKADGTTDIAVGDFLTTFTSAGIAQKATTGDMVFAIALEAYTTDNSSGVLDACLITPRMI